MNQKNKWTIAYDPELRKPGCAIIQAALGATLPRSHFHRFDPNNWIVHPTPHMALMPVDEVQLGFLLELDKNHAPKETS